MLTTRCLSKPANFLFTTTSSKACLFQNNSVVSSSKFKPVHQIFRHFHHSQNNNLLKLSQLSSIRTGANASHTTCRASSRSVSYSNPQVQSHHSSNAISVKVAHPNITSKEKEREVRAKALEFYRKHGIKAYATKEAEHIKLYKLPKNYEKLKEKDVIKLCNFVHEQLPIRIARMIRKFHTLLGVGFCVFET